MERLERATQWMMLSVGCIGIIIIYSGFFYFLFSSEQKNIIPWYTLLSPWICIYFGLSQQQRAGVLQWFLKKR
ncbi:hypothetical protein [uncultured Shewanella sp.]|uniref:hypothetical protein n=1 Tax=uncultured Shewanella sp. TaxID=173975 RepID=UPI0026304E98|nr:hypothetical protein [uncultured Shewanella sp.]